MPGLLRVQLYCIWLSSSRNYLRTNFSKIFLRVIMPVALLVCSSITTPKFTCFFFSWSIASSNVKFSFSLCTGKMIPEALRFLLLVNLNTSRFLSLMNPTILDLYLE